MKVIKKTCKYIKYMINKIKKILKNINKPSYTNLIYISYLYLFTTGILMLISFFMKSYKIEISDDLPFNVYMALSTLMIPLAIFIAQKISDSKDFLTANVYMNQSHIFPMTIFQIISFISLFYIQDYLYYGILIITYAIFIAYLYINTLRLFSDSIYFTKKLKEETKKIIDQTLKMHIDSNESIAKNKSFHNCGIYFENYHYENTDNYEKVYLYPPGDNLLIKELNKKELNNLENIMSQINIRIEDIDKNEVNNEINMKKIIIFLQSEGYTTRSKAPVVKIFYSKGDTDIIKKLDYVRNILDNLYKYEAYNLDIVLKKEIQEIETRCTISICNHSITELKNNLEVYVDFYKAIVDNININIDKDYTLEEVYKTIHSFYTFRGFNYFEYIREELYNLCYHPNALENKIIFNEITSCIYKMLLYSFTQDELISFEYISKMYQGLSYIVNKNEKLDMNKIQLELFEILNYIYYELKKCSNANYKNAKNMIILLNIVIVNIMFELATEDVERYNIFRNKFTKFISNLERDIKQIKSSQYILDILQEILKHCSSNLYVMDSYLYEKKEDRIKEEIIAFYRNKSFKYIISVFLNAHRLDFDSFYNWDNWEKYDIIKDEGVHFVKTSTYMNDLFCNICLKHNNIELPTDRDLVSLYNSSLKNKLFILGCNENSNLILKFEDMLQKYNENGKKYLRETNISEKKEAEFKEKFIKCYIDNNNLYNLMKQYSNVKIVNPAKRRRKLFRNKPNLRENIFIRKNAK